MSSVPAITLPFGSRVLLHTQATQQDDAVVFPALTASAKEGTVNFPGVAFEAGPTPDSFYVKNTTAPFTDKTIVITDSAHGPVGQDKTDTVTVILKADVRTLKTFAIVSADPPEPIP